MLYRLAVVGSALPYYILLFLPPYDGHPKRALRSALGAILEK